MITVRTKKKEARMLERPMAYESFVDTVLIITVILTMLWMFPYKAMAQEAGSIADEKATPLRMSNIDETATGNERVAMDTHEPTIEQIKEQVSKLAGASGTQASVVPSSHPDFNVPEVRLAFVQLEPPKTHGWLTVKHNGGILFTEFLDITNDIQREALLEMLVRRYPRVSIAEVRHRLRELAELLKSGSGPDKGASKIKDRNENSSAKLSTTQSKQNSREDKRKERQLVTNMFYETSIRQALADIAAQTGVIIVPDMSVQGIVTCELKDVPLEEALEIVIAPGGYVVKKMNGYYLVGSLDPKSPNFETFSIASTITITVKLNYLKAEDAKELLPESFADYVKANKERNEVCITAPRAVVARILNDLRNADRPPRQVMLEAKIVELTDDAKEQLGVDWEWEWENPTPGESVRSGLAAFDRTKSTIQLGYATTAEFTKRIFLTLKLLCETNSATILANPRVTAMDGKKAEIKVTTEEYFKITTGPAQYAYATIEAIESGIMLEMTPHIGTGGEITLEVTPEVSDVVGVGAEGLPMITRRKAATTVRVKDGGTVVIGGLANSTTHDMVSKVPLLGDIPVLGGLFKSTEAKRSTRDILIFITPRLLAENGSPEPIATAVKNEPRYEPIEPAGKEFKRQLREVLSRN